MQIDSHIHVSSESIKCLLFDCYTNSQLKDSKQQQQVIACNGYIIKSLGRENAEIYLFPYEYTHFTNVVKIQRHSSIKCIKLARLKQYSFVVYANNATIVLTSIEKQSKNIAFTHQQVSLRQGQYFLAFSDIMKMKHYQLLIAKTSFSQFYLITIKNHKSLQIFQFSNNKQAFSFLSWFKSTSLSVQCKNLFLHTYRIDDGDKFILFLFIKDKTIELYLLQLYPEQGQNIMVLVGSCEAIKKIIPNSALLKQALIITKDSQSKHIDCLISYELKEGFMLILSVHVNHKKKNIFQVNVLFQDLPRNHFSMAYNYLNILYSFYHPEEDSYKIFKKKHLPFQQKRHLENRQVEIFMTLKVQPHFFYIQDQLFINTSMQVYSVQAEHPIYSEQSDLSELQQHLAEFKNEINHNYRKLVHKLLKKMPIPVDQISYLLTQKCRKIIQWIKNEFSEFSSNEEHTYLILTLQIAISIAVKNLLMIINIDDLLKVITSKQPNFCMKELFLILANSQISSVINLLNIISQSHPQIVSKVLEGFNEQEQIKQNCCEAIKTVFMESFEVMHKNMQINPQLVQEYQKIVKNVVTYDLGNPKVYHEIHIKNEMFFKSCILESKSVNLFIDYFLILQFSETQVKQFARTVSQSKKENIKKLIIEILTKIKTLLRKKKLQFGKIGLFIEGFMQYSHEMIIQMKKIFPGLLFFYYMRTGHRKQGLQYIKQLAKNTSSSSSQLLYHSILRFQEDTNQKVQHFNMHNLQSSSNIAACEQILNIGAADSDESLSQKSVGQKKIKIIDHQHIF